MNLLELLAHVREHYVDRLSAWLHEEQDAIGEAAVLSADGTVAREGILELGMRVDGVRLVDGEPDETVEVDTETYVTFETVTFEWDGMSVVLEPFKWNAMWLEFEGVPVSAPFDPIVEWFRKWMDEADTHRPDPETRLLGAVHYLSDPSPIKNGWRFHFDLGSAPENAVSDLLDVIAALGAKRARIRVAA